MLRSIRTLSLSVALFAAGCHFNFDRALSPGEIRGRLLLEDDRAEKHAATDAHVSIVGSALSVPTDNAGRFVMRGLPAGTYQLRVTRDLGGTGRQTTILNLQNIVIETVAGKPGARDLGDVVVAGLGSVHGTLTRNGEIVSGIRVVLKELTEVVAVNGVFALEALPAGTYPVFIVDDQGRTLKGKADHELVVVVQARKQSTLAIELNDLILAEDGTVAGHVYVSNGTDPSGIKVKLTNEQHDEIIATTNSDGLYTGDGPAGVYTLEATKDGYSNSYIQYFVVDGATAAPDMLLVGMDTPGLTCGPDPLDTVATGCGLHATCSDTAGTRSCACLTGFEGNGFACTDKKECDTPTTCDPNATCAETPGSFTCTCKSGFVADGTACVDINECTDGNNGGCSAHATCGNVVGATRTCTCNAAEGYTGDGITCGLGDACLVNFGGCDMAHGTCATANEQPVCGCVAGWHGTTTCQPDYTSAMAGGVATCAIKADGSLWCWGANNMGQVGDGTGVNRAYASQIDPAHSWLSVAGGDDHTCAIRTDGSLWCWGAQSFPNFEGPTRGTNRVTSSAGDAHLSPAQIGTGTNWASLALGTYLSCGIQTDGVLVCWSDTFGEYTDGTGPDFHTIAGSWSKISVGTDHACGIQTDDSLWCWGGNDNGQAGVFDTFFVEEPFLTGGSDTWQSVSAGTDHSCGVKKSDHSLWCWGANSSDQLGTDHNTGEGLYSSATPLQLGAATDWASVSAGDQFGCALKGDGSLWCWGSDYYGELGDGPQDDSFASPRQLTGVWTKVAAGGSHACALKNDGTLWCWGDNEGGNLGNGSTTTTNGLVQVTIFNADFCATNNGGCAAHAYCSQEPSGTSGDATHICRCGDGYEDDGAQGCRIVNICQPDSCDANASCGPLLNDFSCACDAGFGGSGYPGDCRPTSCETAPEGWCDAHASCSLDEGSMVVCQCGPGYAGNGRSCVLTDPCQINRGGCDVNATCANVNVTPVCTCNDGWSGSGTTCQPNYVQVGTGDATSCAVKKDGTLWCWGDNDQGQVGDGTGIDRLYPSLVTTATDWSRVEAGGGYTCAIKKDGTLWCWGGRDNRGGPSIETTQLPGLSVQLTPAQVGEETTWVSLSLGGFGACGIQQGGLLVCVDLSSNSIVSDGDGGLTSGPNATVIPGAPWAQVSVGTSHACGRKEDGSVWCWGYNYSGQLGAYEGIFTQTPQPIDPNTSWLSVVAGGNHTCAVRDDHTLWCWGSNSSNQLGLPTGQGDGGGLYSSVVPAQVGTAADWNTVAAGDDFTCGVQGDVLSCWGADYQGQLGNGPQQQGSATPVVIPGSWTQELSSAYQHSCALKVDGTLWCWGDNYSGDLGNGSTQPSAPVSVYRFPSDPCATSNGGCADHGLCTQLPPGESTDPTVSCECLSGYEGDGTEACTLIDYCSDGSGEEPRSCDSHATCTPVPNDYTCECGPGFDGYAYQEGGCQPTTCAVAANAGWCDVNAACDDNEGVSCRCLDGFTGDGRTCVPSYLTVAAGSGTTCSVKGDHTLWCWGENQSGAVGDGTGEQRLYPSQVDTATDWASVSTSSGYTCAIKTSGTLWCWGGTIYEGGPTRSGPVNGVPAGSSLLPARQLTPAQIGTDTTWTSVSVGGYGVCGLQEGGVLVCVDLGSGSTPVLTEVQSSDGGISEPSPFTTIPGDNPWTQVSVGGSHICGVQSDGSIWCWGYNWDGQVGVADTSFVSAPTQIDASSTWRSIAAGYSHTCAIKTDDTLWCWGSNYAGELGSPSNQSDGGGVSSSTSPLQVGSSTWRSVDAGDRITCGLQSDDVLYCWGSNYYGQLGPNGNGVSTTFNPVSLYGYWRTFSTGDDYVCGIHLDGTLACWGANNSGQQGNGYTYNSQYESDVYNFETDPCRVNNGGCGANSYCTQYLQPTEGPGYPATTCDCTSGYEGDPSAGCTLFDYCAYYQQQESSTCADHAICTPVPNSYTCACAPGFVGNGYDSCQPQDCAAANTAGWCDTNATCSDGTGSVTCACNDGYTGDGRACTNSYRSVVAGLDSTTCAFKGDNTLWCWGENGRAQVGDGSTVNRPYPSEVTTNTSWTSISSGNSYTFATRADGTLWWWGGADNTDGPPNPSSHTPVPVELLPQLTPVQYDDATDWQSVSMGWEACALKTDGSLYCWDQYNQALPALVTGNNLWKSVSVGSTHTCATQTDDSLWCWGYNYYGQTGAFTEGSMVPEPQSFDAGLTWRAVSAGGYHTCAIKTDGTLWCWGYNSEEQSGVNTFGGESNSTIGPTQVGAESDWTAVSAGWNSTCGLRSDGSGWCWGSNGSGQLGVGYFGSTSWTPTQLPGGWKSLSAGSSYACGVGSDSTLWCWGASGAGQLGIGSTDGDVSTPATVYNFTSDPCAVDNGGCGLGAYCTNAPESQSCSCLSGYEAKGSGACTLIDLCELYEGPCGTNATCTPVRNNYLCSCEAGYAGNPHDACVPKDCATASTLGWCDANATCDDGGLSDGSTTCTCAAGFIGDGRTCVREYTSVEAGDHTTCAIKSDGSLWCWGYNKAGQVGDGSGVNKGWPSQIGTSAWAQVSEGAEAACGIQTDGSLWCWGGQSRLSGPAVRSLNLGGAIERPVPVRIGGNTDWDSVSVGEYSACGIEDGYLSCWNPASPENANLVTGGNVWSQVSVGNRHTCAIRQDQSLWCWGYNYDGQVGQTTEATYFSEPVEVLPESTWRTVSAGYAHTCAVATDNTLWCWGDNTGNQLGVDYYTTEMSYSYTPLQIGTAGDWSTPGAGQSFSCGLKLNGEVWCWGATLYGSLGSGTMNQRSAEPLQVSGSWTQLSVGAVHSCGLLSSGELACWGGNNNSEIVPGSEGYPSPVYIDNFASDPCLTNNGGCALVGGYCNHSPSEVSCGCLSGYTGEGSTCTLIDYCNSESCDSHATCTPIPNDVVCTCNAPLTGYGYYQGGCSPPDCAAAAQVGWCGANSYCLDSEGVGCYCNEGWTGNSYTDSCVPQTCAAAAAAGWCSPIANCTEDGIAYCSCPNGFQGDGRTCVDVDECNSQQSVCAPNAVCTNSPGSYDCTCRPGFEGDGHQFCTDTTDWAQWPMPDSQTSVCSDGTNTPVVCPISTDPLGGQDGVLYGRSRLVLNMDSIGQDDPDTGLEWALQVDVNVLADKEPGNVCARLETAGGLSWRVPSITELITLVDYGEPASKLTWVSPGVPSSVVLSNTTSPVTGDRLGVDSDTGETKKVAPDKTGSVVCVR